MATEYIVNVSPSKPLQQLLAMIPKTLKKFYLEILNQGCWQVLILRYGPPDFDLTNPKKRP
jgi:hypothetical protein